VFFFFFFHRSIIKIYLKRTLIKVVCKKIGREGNNGRIEIKKFSMDESAKVRTHD